MQNVISVTRESSFFCQPVPLSPVTLTLTQRPSSTNAHKKTVNVHWLRTEYQTMSCERKLARNRCSSSYEEESVNGLDRHLGDLRTVLTNKHYSGHHKATETEDDPGTLGEEIWRRKCGRQASGTAGGRWR